jgi:uncharacterized NAD(P)/FAD-binding protein YdhS
MSRITAGAPLRVLVVGGGASGVLLAMQLLRKGGGRVAVRVVEKGDALGCGPAYATRDPAHLLNTRVANMSAYRQLPDHFLDWLRAREPALTGRSTATACHPPSHRRLTLAQAQGRLRLVRARFDGAERPGGRLLARLTGPGGSASPLLVDRVVDGRGIRRDPEAHASPLVADLLARGLARIDPLLIGLDVGPDCAVLGRDGRRSARLFALGLASRAAFWEITAIPDIRAQAQRLAERLMEAVPA